MWMTTGPGGRCQAAGCPRGTKGGRRGGWVPWPCVGQEAPIAYPPHGVGDELWSLFTTWTTMPTGMPKSGQKTEVVQCTGTLSIPTDMRTNGPDDQAFCAGRRCAET